MNPAISYFAQLGFQVDQPSLRRVDSALSKFEKRIKTFGKNFDKKIGFTLSTFSVDSKKLISVLGNSLDAASKSVVFEISRFAVNERNLQAALVRASRRLNQNGLGGFTSTPQASQSAGRSISAAEERARMRRLLEEEQKRIAMRERTTLRATRGLSREAGLGGSIAGGISRVYGPALALGLGGYGLSALNSKNQQIVSAELQSQAVVQQAGGTQAQGKQSFEWLKQQGNRIGFNWLEASPDYNKLLSGLSGAGMSIKQGQDVFKGFAELSRVNKLDRVQQQRVYRALSQVAGKGKLQSEELVGQLAESLPGATSLFAQAYQKQLAAEGKGKGDKTGQAAITELLNAMKKGQVNSGILTYAGTEASLKANEGGALGRATTASQAEQQRYQNAVNALAETASNSGLESGFARLFRTLNTGLEQSGPLVAGLAEGFDTVSKYVSSAFLSIQSLQRFFDGKDSYIGDKYFPKPEDREKFFTFVESLKGAMKAVGDLARTSYSGWQQLLKLLDDSDSFKRLTDFSNFVANTSNTLNNAAKGDYKEAGKSGQGVFKSGAKLLAETNPITSTLNMLTGGALNNYLDQKTKELDDPAAFESQTKGKQDVTFWNRVKDRYNGTVGVSPIDNSSTEYPVLNSYLTSVYQDKVIQDRKAEGYQGPVGILPMDQDSVKMPPTNSGIGTILPPKADVKLDVTVKIDAANPEDFGQKFQQHLSDIVHQTLDKYSEK